MKNLIFIFIFVYGGLVQASLEEAKMKYEASRDITQRQEGELEKCLADMDKHRDEYKNVIADWNNTVKTNNKAKIRSVGEKLKKHVKTSEERASECAKIVDSWITFKLIEIRKKRNYTTETLKQ